jgi:hypothetical protein
MSNLPVTFRLLPAPLLLLLVPAARVRGYGLPTVVASHSSNSIPIRTNHVVDTRINGQLISNSLYKHQLIDGNSVCAIDEHV